MSTDIKDTRNKPKPSASPLASAKDDTETNDGIDGWSGYLENGNNKDSRTYSLESKNWYTAKPYGFKTTTNDEKIFTMFLPISPSNLNITTNFATNVISTLYGTVEEHSDVRYYDIAIEGTTGMSPSFVAPFVGEPDKAFKERKGGRFGVKVSSSANAAGGFFAKTLAIYNQVKQKAAEIANGSPKPRTGIHPEDSGYVAFHNLYRFLLQYKKDAAGVGTSGSNRKVHPLTFFNYKDNNQYDVAVRGFSMRRSADNPMLYYYSIQLRGYNLRSISNPIKQDYNSRLRNLGLDGIDSSSLLGKIKSLSSKAKSIVGAVGGGLGGLGG